MVNYQLVPYLFLSIYSNYLQSVTYKCLLIVFESTADFATKTHRCDPYHNTCVLNSLKTYSNTLSAAPHCTELTRTAENNCRLRGVEGQMHSKQRIDLRLFLQYSRERKKLWLYQSSIACSGVLNLGYRPHRHDRVSSTAWREGKGARSSSSTPLMSRLNISFL